MNDDMTDKFRLFRRASGVWYIEDRETKEQGSLRTRDAIEAKRLFNANRQSISRLPGLTSLPQIRCW
jgi:hypothetical protein